MQSKKNYDSTFCGSLPLHLINVIQPYGILVVLNKDDLKVVQVSENIETVTGLPPANFVNTFFGDYINPSELNNLKKKFDTEITGKVPVPLTITNKHNSFSFLAIVHAKDGYLVLELEQVELNNSQGSFINVYQEIKYSMANISIANTVTDICDIAITELKQLSGFDRVMVYKFDEEWNGTVIAEVMEAGMDPYLGLRFPASDIPKQSRDLYFKNPYRLIPTIDYTPVKIYPVINPVTNSFIDLSNGNLRGVPAVHLEYLKNMNVMASMSTAIIKDDKLWGLISCHHRSPKYLSYETCSLFELMAGVISSRLSSVVNKEVLEANADLQKVQSQLIGHVYADESVTAGLINHETTVLDILRSEGAIIAYDKSIATIGKTPGKSEIKDLILWLQSYDKENTYTIDNLSSAYEDAAGYSGNASGIIVLPIHQEKGEYVIGFRPEVIRQVNWGGNPNEAINFEEDKKKYHPRNSFKLWQETVKNTCLPWSKDELTIAESFRNFVIEYTLKRVYSLV